MAIRGSLSAALLPVAAAALLAAGCGSHKAAETSTESSAVTWADSLCTSITTYKTSLTAAVTSVRSDLSANALKSAVSQADAATTTFVNDVKGLGKPDTSSGQQASDDISSLATKLGDDLATVKTAIAGVSGPSGLVSAISVAGTTLLDAQNQIKTTYTELQQLPKGELQQAFKTAPACTKLSSG